MGLEAYLGIKFEAGFEIWDKPINLILIEDNKIY